jgi:succinyl-diaminopimelate desuccinylase
MKSPRFLIAVILVLMCPFGRPGSSAAPAPGAVDVTQFIKEPELTALAQKLVQIRSDYDEGNYAHHKEMAQFLGDRFRELGFEVNIIEPEPNYPTVVARLHGTTGTPALGMIAHYNTVAIGDPAKWTVDPFSGLIKDGRIYGRGSSDQKMALAASIVAAKAIKDAGIKLAGDLVMLCIPGEGAQTHSLPYIVRDRPQVLKADWYLDTEGGPDIVKIAGGWVWTKITVDGTTGHTGSSAGGGRPVNAVYRLAHVLSAIEDVDTWMTYKKNPLFPQQGYDGKPIVEVGKIEGGYKVNQVPDHAEAQIDIRLLPGQSPDGVLTEMRAVFDRLKAKDPQLNVKAEAMTTQWVPMKYWDSLTDDDRLIKAIREVAPPLLGHTPGWSGSIGGGRPDVWETGAKWVSFGVGGGANAHAPNEYATIAGGMKRAELYAKLMLRVLGGQGLGGSSPR